MTRQIYNVLVKNLPWEELIMLLNWLENNKLESLTDVDIYTNGSTRDDKDD